MSNEFIFFCIGVLSMILVLVLVYFSLELWDIVRTWVSSWKMRMYREGEESAFKYVRSCAEWMHADGATVKMVRGIADKQDMVAVQRDYFRDRCDPFKEVLDDNVPQLKDPTTSVVLAKKSGDPEGEAYLPRAVMEHQARCQHGTTVKDLSGNDRCVKCDKLL